MKQLKASGNLYLDQEHITKYLPEEYRDGTHPCEQCNMSLNEHDWIELDPEGFVTKCSVEYSAPSMDADTDDPDKIMYVHTNKYGSIEKELPYRLLYQWYRQYELGNELALGCWEIKHLSTDEFLMRIATRCWPGGRTENDDKMWYSWQLTFVPKQYVTGTN